MQIVYTFADGKHKVLDAWPSVEDEDIGDGTYGYLLEFIAPNGESSMSNAALFEIKYGHITSKI